MITAKRLKGAYSEGEALAIYNEVRATGADFAAFARTYMHHNDYQVARNAMWGLTKATDDELSQLQPMLNELIDLAMNHGNPSVRRLTLNVIVRLHMGEDNLRSDFLDWCLDRMVNLEEFPGTQSLCMKLTHRMCKFYPELMDELLRIVRDMEIEYYKPAVKSVRTRILNGKSK